MLTTSWFSVWFLSILKGDWCSRQDGRDGSHHILAYHGDHPTLLANHGNGERAFKDSSDVYCAEDTFG